MENLGINGGMLIAQLVNFGLVLFALTAMAWRPLVNALEARREKIAKGLEDARLAEQARANAERDAQRIVDERRAEAQKLVEEGRVRGEDQAKQVVEEARREAEAIRQKARQDAEEERNATLGQVRMQVAQIAMAAAERVIGQSLDDRKGKAIINDFLSALPENISQIGNNVEVTSALPLSEAEQRDVYKRLGVENVSFHVDPSILGGLVLRSGERIIDGSARSNLNKLSQQLY